MDIEVLREQLLQLLDGRNAHITFDNAVAKIPMTHINAHVPNIPYSLWELLEHMRIAQYDILDFIININYKERKWPQDYWPPSGAEANEENWGSTLKKFQDDFEALKEIVKDPNTDFTGPLSHAPEYTILREIMLVADHNAYHTGQIIVLRRALKIY